MNDFENFDDEIKNYVYTLSCKIETDLWFCDSYEFLNVNYYYDLENVTEIDFKDTKNIPVEFIIQFHKFKNLKSVDISKSKIINDIILYFPNLEKLSITTIDIPPLHISNPKLKHLKLTEFKQNREYVKYIMPSSLENFEYVYVDNVFFNIIENLENIKKLNLISNIKRNINEKIYFKTEKFKQLKSLEKIAFEHYIPNNVLDIIDIVPDLKKVSFNYFKNIFYPEEETLDISKITNIKNLTIKFDENKNRSIFKFPNIPECIEKLSVEFNIDNKAKIIMDNLPIGLKILKIKFQKLSLFIKLNNLPISLEKLYFTYKIPKSKNTQQTLVNLLKENTKLPFGCEMYLDDHIINFDK